MVIDNKKLVEPLGDDSIIAEIAYQRAREALEVVKLEL